MAALEIAKGGLTTDPDNHSGEELHTLINLFDQVGKINLYTFIGKADNFPDK